MKKTFLLIALALTGLGAGAKIKPIPTGHIQTIAQEERTVADFTGISSGGYFNVYVSFGDKTSLRLEGDAEILKDIETKVEKDVLKIQLTGKKRYWDWNSSDRKKVNVYITAKKLTDLSVSGSGNMKVDGLVNAPAFKAVVSGSGNLLMRTESINFTAVISGSGTINLSGDSQNSDITISGSGSFNAKDFKTKTATITVSGSGNASLVVEKSLKGNISGSGSIRYDGNPDITENRSGSGKISKM